jgi:hypothetical protein
MKIFLFFIATIMSIFFISSLTPIFSELENTYTNEKCGVSIQYPNGWTVEESDFATDMSKTISDFQSGDEDIFGLSFAIENIGLAKKSITEIADWYKDYGITSTTSTESGILSSGIGEINGFPSYEVIYYEGSKGDDKSQDEKFHTQEILIIAHDREYRLTYEAPNKADLDKYSSIVEEMANSIKISKPSFEGINCILKSPSKNSDQELSTKKDNIVNIVSGDSNIQETAIPINVIDDIMRKHQQFAYTLGNPSSDIQITYDSQGYYQKFSKGIIYWHPQFGVHEIHGGISDKWENLGNENGTLGYPISDEYDIDGGRQSDFEKGHISWSEENGEITVVMSKE